MNHLNNDIDLIKKLQKGDTEAFDKIYKKYAGKLYLFAMKYLRSADEAGELVQSVFLKVWENHKKLKEESSFKSFLFTIAYNNICKLFRRRYYLKQFINETLNEKSETSTETEEKIDYQSTLNRIMQIVDKLPERQKTIFLKSRQEGKTTKEIAKELKLSPGTVDNYISEAIKFIRSRLSNEDLVLLLLISAFLVV